MKLTLSSASAYLKLLLKPVFLRSALTTLLLAPLAARADLVAHLRFDGDLKDVNGHHDGRPVDPKLKRIGICFLPPGTISSAWTRER